METTHLYIILIAWLPTEMTVKCLNVCVLACQVTTQRHTTTDESLRLISPTSCSVFRFSLQSSTSPSLHPSLHPHPSLPLSQHRADYQRGSELPRHHNGRRWASAAAVQKLRRFNFLLFIVATQTTFKLLPFRTVPLPSRPNLCLSRPKIFTAQRSRMTSPPRNLARAAILAWWDAWN